MQKLCLVEHDNDSTALSWSYRVPRPGLAKLGIFASILKELFPKRKPGWAADVYPDLTTVMGKSFTGNLNQGAHHKDAKYRGQEASNAEGGCKLNIERPVQSK